MSAQAQGTLSNAAEGNERRANTAGSIGGIVEGAVSAATGTVSGILGVGERPHFRSYVRKRDVRFCS